MLTRRRARDATQERGGVIVAHPGRQHSHQLAIALHRAGLLDHYWTGVPTHVPTGQAVGDWLWRRYVRYDTLPLPPELVRCRPIAPLVRKLLTPLVSRRMAIGLAHRGEALFDRWSAAALRGVPKAPPVVICYENAARRTFTEARRRGIFTVLDAASVHHAEQDRVDPPSSHPRVHRRITARKDAEIALADHIVTVSELARESYLAAGVPANKVSVVTLGADLSRFSPPIDERRTDGPLHLVFAGHIDHRKGIDVLTRAIEASRARGREIRLTLVGAPAPGHRVPSGADIDHVGRVTQDQLAAIFRRASCLVLPSRHDSFGMVVVEALASGLPVLVSNRVGAKTLVRDGENGWVVPVGDSDALAARIDWCADHPEALAAMSGTARASVADQTWDAYHVRIVDLLRRLPDRFRHEER